jgi:hypothetical protein
MENYHSFTDQQQIAAIVKALEEANAEELASVTRILSTITNLPSDRIEPSLHSMMESLIELRETPLYAGATAEEWSAAFTSWVESHRSLELPSLSDEAISREEMYGERG